jgi:hypothetical protein
LYMGTGNPVGRLGSSHKSTMAPASTRIKLKGMIVTMGMEATDQLGRWAGTT